MAKENTLKLTPSFDLFSKSTNKVKKHLRLYLGVNILPMLALAAIVLPIVLITSGPEAFDEKSSEFIMKSLNPVSMIVIIASIIFALSVYSAVVTVACLNIAKSKNTNIKSIWEIAKPKIVDMFIAQFVAALMVLGGAILFIVPGFYMMRRYYLVSYYIADQDLSPIEALKKCKEQSIKASGYIWGLLGVTLLFALTGIIPMVGGIISTVLGIMYGIAPALRYLEIKKL